VGQNLKVLLILGIIGILLIGSLIYVTIPKENSGDVKDVSVGVNPPVGNPAAKIKLIEFGDFQCPACKASHPIINRILQDYQKEVVLYYRNFPLSMHENSFIAAEAAECANEQGKFWEYHDILFENQNKLDKDNLKKHAVVIGLDESKFNECLDLERYKIDILNDISDAKKLNLKGTPTFFINGKEVFGGNEQELRKLIEEELKRQK